MYIAYIALVRLGCLDRFDGIIGIYSCMDAEHREKILNYTIFKDFDLGIR